jgi:hypothetical protein
VMFVDDRDELLVVREWPDGSLTAYLASRTASESRKDRT